MTLNGVEYFANDFPINHQKISEIFVSRLTENIFPIDFAWILCISIQAIGFYLNFQ